MEPITDCFEKLKAEFEKVIITYEYYKVDTDEPENIHLKNIPDLDIIWEGNRFYINGNDLIGFYFNDLIKQTQGEIVSNIKMPIDTQTQIAYLEEVIEFSSKIEESIIKKNGNWTHVDAKYKEFIYDELPDYEKEFLSSSIKAFKNTFRNLTAFVISCRNSLELPEKKTKEDKITSDPILQIDMTQDLASELLIRSFSWKRNDDFKRDILILFELLANQYKFIPEGTDLKTFSYAFSGKSLLKPLRIKWLVTGKNKLSSKSSLFHFISKLEDSQLIESKDWSKNNAPLYQKIFIIFVDKDDNLFTIDGLKSSRSQGLKRNCAKQSEIDSIVKRIAQLTTAKLPE